MRIADVMTTELVTTTPETALKDAASDLVRHRISGLPVVDAEGRVVGVLSEADVVAKEVDRIPRTSALQRFLEGPPVDARFGAITVGEAMSTPALVIGRERPVAEAASIMLSEGVNRLPVIDDHERLVGLVTRADLVRAFARDDEKIAGEIADLLRHDLWLDPSTLDVAVVHGHVTLTGEVADEAEARVVRVLVRRVPGVTEVTSLLRPGRAAVP